MAHENGDPISDDDSFRSLLARLDESSEPGQVLARGGIDPATATPPTPSVSTYAELCASATMPMPMPGPMPGPPPGPPAAAQPALHAPTGLRPDRNKFVPVLQSLRSGVVWAALAGGVSAFGLIWLLLIYWSANQHIASSMPRTGGMEAPRRLTQASMDASLIASDPARSVAAPSSASSLVEAVSQLDGLGAVTAASTTPALPVTKPETEFSSLPGVHIDPGSDTRTAAVRTPVGALHPRAASNDSARVPVAPEEIKLLIAPASRAQAGENSPLAIKLSAPNVRLDQLRVSITGLPPGATLSAGHVVPSGGWQISARGLDALLVGLPATTRDVVHLELEVLDETGGRLARAATVIVVTPSVAALSPPVMTQPETAAPVAHAQVAAVARAAAVASVPPVALPPMSPPVATSRPAAVAVPPPVAPPPAAPAAQVAAKAEPAPGPAPPAKLPAPRLSMDDDTAMIERGRLLARNGDIAGARLLFERAADTGSGRAALLLGETYDPEILAGLRVMGTRGDRAKARQWYARAGELGVAVAAERLRALAER